MLTDKDKGYRSLLERMARFREAMITVGIHAAEGAETYPQEKATVADVASFHEYGLGVPERSFLRATFDANEDKNKAAIRAAAEAVAKGEDEEKALDRLGLAFVGQVQKAIADRIPPPLAESTIERKGSDVPLIDTGQLRSSITYEVK